MRLSLVAVALLAAATITTFVLAEDAPPPLTTKQLDQVRELVRRTQTEQARLKSAMAETQEKLAGCYAVFELDEKQVTALQQEIVELQRKLLASHHTMQKELRTLVGPERFKILNRRIENALRSPSPAKDE